MAARRSKSRFAMPDLAKPASRRPSRVADAICKEVALVLLQKIKDPRLALVTITGVDVSPDLKNARIMYSCAKEEVAQVEKGLESATGFIRTHLAGVLAMRYVPKIRFEHDLSLEKREEVERLFVEIENERKQRSE